MFENKKYIISTFLLCLQAVVEEIQVKTAELGKIQKSGHVLMEAITGNIHKIKYVPKYL